MISRDIIVNKGSVVGYVVMKGDEKISERVKLPEDCSQTDYDPDCFGERFMLKFTENYIH